MSVCTLTPIVRIYEDFDKMSAEELSYCESDNKANKSDPVVIKKVHLAANEYFSSSCDEDSPKLNRMNACSSSAPVREDEKPKRTRKLSDGRKKSTSNLLYKCSKSFADTHPTPHSTAQKRATTSSRRHLDTQSGGLRKQLLSRRSPSPLNANDAIMRFSHGYEQYQMSFLEVPLPRDYGDASSDDLSSEWDSDVPDLEPTQKVFYFLNFFFFNFERMIRGTFE